MDKIAQMSMGSKWCYMSKSKISRQLDIPRTTVRRAIKTLKEKGLIIQHKSKSSHLAPSKQWREMFADDIRGIAVGWDSQAFVSYIEDGVIPPPKSSIKSATKKVESQGGQNGQGVAKMTHNNKIYNSKKLLEGNDSEAKRKYREKMDLPEDFKL